MKRYCILLLAILMLLTTACTNSTQSIKLDPKNPIQLTLWHYYHGPQKNAFDERVSDFNQTIGLEQGIIIEAHSYGSVAELFTAVLSSAMDEVGAADMPDIFASYADHALRLDLLNKLANLEDYITENEKSQYIESYLNEGYLSGGEHLKIFPTAKATEIAMLNKTDFDAFVKETGLSLRYEDLQTYEGIISIAELYYNWTNLQTPSIANDGKAFFGLDYVSNFAYVTAAQKGEDLFVVIDGELTLNYTEETMRTIWDIYYTNMIKGYFKAKARYRSDDAKIGDILYMVASSTGAAYFPTQVTDIDGNSHPVEMEAIPVPVVSGGKKIAIQQGAGMCVSKTDEKREYAAMVFLKWFTEPERNAAFAMTSGGYMPVTKEGMNAERIQALLTKAYEEGDSTTLSAMQENTAKVVEAFLDQFDDYTFYTPVVFENSDTIRTLLDEFGADTLTAVEEAWTRINAGEPYDEVVAEYCSEEAFQKWYASFDTQVKKIMNN